MNWWTILTRKTGKKTAVDPEFYGVEHWTELIMLKDDKHYYDKEVKNKIIADGQLKYERWMDHELRSTIETVIGLAMSNQSLLTEPALLSIFEWILANQKESHLNTHYPVIRLQVTDIIHQTFLQQIQHLDLSAQLQTAIGLRRWNWTQIPLLYAVFRKY